MKIAVLYIGIGKYKVFWSDFYRSCEKYFLPDAVKKYFLFTDKIDELQPNNVKEYFQEDLGWPGNTLFRFKMFLNNKEELEAFDYIYFFNGNALFLDTVSKEEIIPDDSNGYLVALSWHIYESIPKVKYPYERDSKSAAYMPMGQGSYYYQGGLNGGRSKEYLKLMEHCNSQIMIDYEKGIVASHHDESHLNKYLSGLSVKVIGTKFGCPEEWSRKRKTAKIIFRTKEKLLGYNDLMKYKNSNVDFYSKIKTMLHNLFIR